MHTVSAQVHPPARPLARSRRGAAGGMSRCRLKEWYNIVVRPDLMAKMQYTNTHAVPKLSALSVQVTTKQASSGLDNAVPAAFILELVTGQTAALTRVKRANAMYKVRPGHLEGAKVTLHGEQMYHFLDRVVTQVRLDPSRGATAGPPPAASPATAVCPGAAAHHRFQRPQPEVLRRQRQLRSRHQRLQLLFGGAWRPTPDRWSLRWRESRKLTCAPPLRRSRRSTPTCNTSTCRTAPTSTSISTRPRKRTTRRSCCSLRCDFRFDQVIHKELFSIRLNICAFRPIGGLAGVRSAAPRQCGAGRPIARRRRSVRRAAPATNSSDVRPQAQPMQRHP